MGGDEGLRLENVFFKEVLLVQKRRFLLGLHISKTIIISIIVT